MIKGIIKTLGDPIYVAKIQKFCGVEPVNPTSCNQQTTTQIQNNKVHGTTPEINGNDISKNGQNGSISSSNGHTNGHITSQKYCNGNSESLPNGEKFTVQNGSNTTARKRELDHSTSNGHEQNNIRPNTHSKLPSNGVSPCSDMNKSVPGLSSKNNDILCQNTVDYTIKYKSLYYLAKFGAFLGNEECFLTFFPFCIWNLDFLIVRQVSYLWCLVMYVGQAAKDRLQWPRPACPPVVRLEVHYLQEFSMPSTHAMAGTAIPLYMATLAVQRYQFPAMWAVGAAMTWWLVTCWSRLYLGVHTLLDLLVGWLTSVAIFFIFLRYIREYDLYLQTHFIAAPVLLTGCVALCTVCYPSDFMNSSKGDAVQVVSGTAGANIGAWLGYQLGIMHVPAIGAPYVMGSLTLAGAALMAARFVSGTACVVAIYLFMKWWTVPLFSYLQGLDRPDKTNGGVITGYKFCTYGMIGFSVSFLIPLLHVYMGIHRPNMFHEVL